VRLPEFDFKREAYLISAILFIPVLIALIAAILILIFGPI
jgi:hypothetical protein